MSFVTVLTISPEEIMEHDVITHVDGAEVYPEPTVRAVRGNQIALTPSGFGERNLYADQVDQVTVRRTNLVSLDETLDFTPGEVQVTMDALMLAAEEQERRGCPSETLRAALRKLHYFNSPTSSVGVTVRQVKN